MTYSKETLIRMARGAGFESLAGKVVFVTGGTSGIGLAMAHAFAASGAHLGLLGRNAGRLDATRQALEAACPGVQVLCFEGAVEDEAAVKRAIAQTHEKWGHLDVLLNNAGISMNCPTLELTGEQWRHAIDVDLNGAFYCAQAAGRIMVAQQSGVIINTTSMYGKVAAPNRAAYCASKAAVAMLTQSLAVEWGAQGVRVNAIAPGYVRTALVDELVASGRLDIDALQRRTPSGRLGTPEEIAALVLFLASDHAAFINGHVMVADGGWSAYGYI